ncbi:MAG TPA: hypothetical protein VG309_05915 [Rhizomicrobium sp.]|nr:hypothetical protein [Rhizomicrobium sp.]
MSEKMRGLTSKRIQVDEIWSYVGKKQRFLKPTDDRSQVGDMWTFVALDADTKLVPAFHIGKRTKAHATVFMNDLAQRLTNRVQISADALRSYMTPLKWRSATMLISGNRLNSTKPSLSDPDVIVRQRSSEPSATLWRVIPIKSTFPRALWKGRTSPCGWGCAGSRA